MGIRFFCQACDKRLNVKGFLAGKRGVCPHCGAKVDIPWESQSAPAGVAASATTAPRSVSPTPLPTGPREAQPSYAQGPINGHGYGGPAMATPTVVHTAQLIQSTATQQPAYPIMAGAVTAVAVAAPSAPPPSAGQGDPIAEAPQAVWYVRPPSGGQYGPASGEIMRKWIGEGRVSADSLIWREGWPDWKTAASQFPDMAGDNAPRTGASPAFPTQPAFSSPIEAPLGRVATRRKSNNKLAMIVVIVLALAALALIVALFMAIKMGMG
jgi:hypothetical protein